MLTALEAAVLHAVGVGEETAAGAVLCCELEQGNLPAHCCATLSVMDQALPLVMRAGQVIVSVQAEATCHLAVAQNEMGCSVLPDAY